MVAKKNNLIFKDAEKAKDAIMDSQKKEIASLYNKWADDISGKANYYMNKNTSSSIVSELQMKQLRKQLKGASENISKEVEGLVKNNLHIISDSVVKSNNMWLKSLGFTNKELDIAFSSVSDNIVRNLVTGQIYDSGWSLSKRIWDSNKETLSDLYKIVAGGLAKNESVYDISKKLERFVRPGARKQWNLKTKDGKRIYPKKVDYNAQRLARTLAQHSYQQSFIATTKDNPFILEYVWNSNGSRVCEVCKARDGEHYQKDELPMDHPNGMCVIVPVVSDNIVDRLSSWFNEPDGTYPEIDEFAKKFGYEPSKMNSTKDYISKYGTSAKSSIPSWKNSMSPIQQAELKSLKDKLGYTWDELYLDGIYTGDGSNLSGSTLKLFNKKNGIVDDAFNEIQDKYLSPYGFSPKNMPTNFNDWSYKVSHSHAGEILKSMGTSWTDPHPYQQLEKYFDKYLVKGMKLPKVKPKPITKVGKVKEVIKEKVNAVKTNTSTWLDKIKTQTQSSMLKKEEITMRVMGSEGQDAIRTYSGSAYSKMNEYLREIARGSSEQVAKQVSGISDSLLDAVNKAKEALSTSTLDEDLILRRGTNLGDLAGAFMDGDFETNKNSLYGKSVEELNDMFKNAVGNYGGFTSTSSIWDRGFSGDVEVIIFAPKGTKGSSIMNISRYGVAEGETLLNAGTKVRCVSVEKSDYHKNSSIRVFLEILLE